MTYPFPVHSHTCSSCNKEFQCQGYPPDLKDDIPAYDCSGEESKTCRECLIKIASTLTDPFNGGYLTKEHQEKFVRLVSDKQHMRRSCRIVCPRCGSSWPVDAEELACTCAPNEVKDALITR